MVYRLYVVLLLASYQLIASQAFELSPACTLLTECEASVLNVYGRCMDMANLLMPHQLVVGVTTCEQRWWSIIDSVIDSRFNDTDRFLACLKTQDPAVLMQQQTMMTMGGDGRQRSVIADQLLVNCTSTLSNFHAHSVYYAPVIDALFGRVQQELSTFLAVFPANVEFNTCMQDAFLASRRCYPLLECCDMAHRCRESLTLPASTVLLNRLYNTIHSFNGQCSLVDDFVQDPMHLIGGQRANGVGHVRGSIPLTTTTIGTTNRRPIRTVTTINYH